MKDILQKFTQNGAMATLAAVGVLAVAGMAKGGGGSSNAHNAGMLPVRPAKGSSKRRRKASGSPKRRAGSKSAYNQFVGKRVKQLHAQGYKASQAMKVAAKEWSAR